MGKIVDFTKWRLARERVQAVLERTDDDPRLREGDQRLLDTLREDEKPS
jgi:hypothetical protein